MKDIPKGTLLFKAGEVAERLGLEGHILRYWEKEFSDFVKPIKIGSRKKLYTRADVETFATIRDLLHVEGYSVDGARKRLKSMGPRQNRLFGDPGEGEPQGTPAGDGQGEDAEASAKKLLEEIREGLKTLRDFLIAPKRPQRPRKNAGREPAGAGDAPGGSSGGASGGLIDADVEGRKGP